MIDLPLSGVRVIDAVPGVLGSIGRLLGELGAEVIRVEPRGGGADRRAGDTVVGASLSFVAANLGKTATAIDLPREQARLLALAREADILLEAGLPGLDRAALREAVPTLIHVAISDLGAVGPWKDWQASDAVLHALTGGLSRSGLPGRPPLLPPGQLALETAGPQIAVAALGAFIGRLRTGEGERVDVSLLEAGMQALDPGFGLSGSAQSGVPLWKMPHSRTDARHRYPILPCADGFVRFCILAPRQWRAMHAWMGAPEAFAGPEWDRVITRATSPDLLPAITRFLADKTRGEIEEEAARRGVPAAAVLDASEAVATPQMIARNAFVPVEIAPGCTLPFPNGTIEIDGARAGVRGPAPALSEDARFIEPRASFDAPPAADYPLAGVRVLDMGVIVVGGETGRLLADLGADVVKVENSAFPDGQRQSLDDAPVSLTFAAGHRNKRGLSIDLRAERGKQLFLDLVRQADVLLSNFKPGTLASLGFDAETLRAANPRLIAVDSSAFGPTGPWSRRLGYGPLVRASAGLSRQWVYPDAPDAFCDTVTVYPDHVAARIGTVGALALLIRRMRTGAGGMASVSQAEVMLGHMAADIARRAANTAGIAVEAGVPAEDWLLPCAGDDEWCVATLRSAADRAAVAALVGGAGQDAAAAWARTLPPQDAAAQLQDAGVPAGMMVRVADLPKSPGYQALGTFRAATHPLLPTPFQVEGPIAHFERVPVPDQRPAPRIGEDSAEVLRDWLGLSDDAIAPLLADKIIEQAA
ncbi:CaiB/BaiF CoA-transferase family protein [Sphingomonas dokdonensis]|uniref:Succinyl-CoA:(R)-benzylsuccinate CoA-transferase subunit BbsF n=1 Tax=Sphingomonas dokdonensis TaxID=344880 RepID=A0A245ZKF8_9SPHN|nr:CoA transferase [Sphingomonas dokdonensis]OWK30219.1 succinyl-CoA:(R)-benzylsuccinate CoA-transferase subunit BbsF [Sphingomonas dokdonensis]